MSVAQKFVSGTFSATGQSAALVSKGKIFAALDFSGTGTVALEARPPGGDDWFVVETYTADACKMVGEDLSYGLEYRLNCSAIEAAETIKYALGA